jgi:GT2 family glycosyltransferase
MNAPPRVATVVVTFNRQPLLARCIDALIAQTVSPSVLIVINNASTDGTSEWLTNVVPGEDINFDVVTLANNTGGAGGFAEGMRRALDLGADWIWMMDDDAEPHPDALAELIRIASNPANIYGSLATNNGETSWLMTLLESPPRTVDCAIDIPAYANVQMLPFLGFLIHRDLVAKIGLPDAGFFIAADDVEYCVRAQRAGAEIIVAGRSHIEHPKSRPYRVNLPGYTLTCLELPPWKRYYDTRNRLLIARKYYGTQLFTRTIPGSFVRLLAALLKEPRKIAQLRAFFAGFVDGLLGRKGRRHEIWGIK